MASNSLHPESASHRAYVLVRDGILDGTYPGGTLLAEGQFAEQLGVSRTPVREAFLQLAAEGMLALYPKKGALVITVTIAELREVFEARMVLETWAASIVTKRADHEQVAADLTVRVDAMEVALKNFDDMSFQSGDWIFHQTLVDAAGNGILASVYSTLRAKQMRSFSFALRQDPDRAREIVEQHRGIVSRILLGSTEEATRLISEHIGGTAAIWT